MNAEKLCFQVCEQAKLVGKFIKNERISFNTSKIEVKGKNDFVSYVDKTSESMLVKSLGLLLPEAGFIVEEKTVENRGKKYNWIIDPLDGTTNFIHGLPCFAISIALMEDDNIVLGVVYEINLDECFYAWKDSPAFLNNELIKVSEARALKDSLLATGFPYYDYGRLNQYMQVFDYCIKNTHGLRRLGSAAVDLIYVACGRLDGFYEYGLNAWDVAAGAFIVQQAGGKVSDFSGADNYIFGREIIATNRFIFEEFLAIVKPIMTNSIA